MVARRFFRGDCCFTFLPANLPRVMIATRPFLRTAKEACQYSIPTCNFLRIPPNCAPVHRAPPGRVPAALLSPIILQEQSSIPRLSTTRIPAFPQFSQLAHIRGESFVGVDFDVHFMLN